MDDKPLPASARLPTELRLEIWKHYMNAVDVDSLQFPKVTKPLTAYQDAITPKWRHEWAQGWDHYVAFLEPKLPAITFTLFEVYTEPALLSSCDLFRNEALPMYLERLEKIKETQEELMDRELPVHYTPDRKYLTRYWERRNLDLRLTVLTNEINRTQFEVDKLKGVAETWLF